MRCLEGLVLAACVGCSSDYSLGELPQVADAPSLRTGAAAPTGNIVYATDGHALFTFSPVTATFSKPTVFRGCDLTVVEISVDDRGEMYAAGFDAGRAALYRVDPATARCTFLSRVTSSAPWAVGLLPNAETLVGASAGPLVLIDPAPKAMTTLSNPSQESARDIVVAPSGTTYVSMLLDWTDPSSKNVLEEIDPGTGSVLRSSDLGGGEVIEGLAVWDGETHGFGSDGSVFVLDVEAAPVTRTPVSTANGPLHFTGAASYPRPDVVPY